MTPTLLIQDGQVVSVEAAVNGRRHVDVRIWRPTSDELLWLDSVDVLSLRERDRIVSGLPEDCRGEAHQLLIRLADEIFARLPIGADTPPKAVANLQTPCSEMEQARLWDSCRDLATQENLLARVAEAATALGVVGADRQVKLVYLAITSRLLDRPVSLAIKGPSAAGKSYPLEQTLKLFPDEAYYEWTAMSERALAYDDEPLQHRMLVLYEAAGMGGDTGSYLLRSLLSEGRLKYMTVEKTAEGIRSRMIERTGPTGLITTTTKVSLHPENETRLLSITVSDSPDQTRKVYEAIACDSRQPFDTQQWQNLQRWLESGERRVAIPFGGVLAQLIPTTAVRLRRDFGLLLNLIRAHAVLHQATRERDGQGRVVASLSDYSMIRELVADLIAEGVEAAVSPSVRETVEVVDKLRSGGPSGGVTVSAVARDLKLDPSAAYRRVQTAIRKGYLKNEQTRSRLPAQLVLGEPLPDNMELVPRLQEVEKVCRFAGEREGIEDDDSPERGDAWEPGEAAG